MNDIMAPQQQRAIGALRIEGEMTIYRAAELKQALLAALEQADALDIDLSGVTEIDCAGVQLLLLAQRSAQQMQRQLRHVEPSVAVRDVFALLELDMYFDEPACA